MRIIAKSTLVAYYTKNPQSKAALEDWYEKTKAAEWKCFADMRQTFNSVDSVGNKRYVFNIKGNDYRLVVLVKFTVSHVLIRFVGTHSEYDKITDLKNVRNMEIYRIQWTSRVWGIYGGSDEQQDGVSM